MDAFARQFTNELAILLAPDLSDITLFETLSFGTVGALIAVITYSIDFFLLGLVVLIYFIREITLYLFTLLMPIAIALWIPGVGPFSLVSKFMQRLAGFYVPFLFMTVPVALLFRLAELLGNNLGFSVQGLGLWLAALVLPILAIVAPFVLVWQAGSIFFMAQSASRHASARRARSGISRTRNAVGSTVRGGRNAVRGVRGKPAISSDGQTQLGSGTSRAHAAGSRLGSTGSGLRGALSRSNEGASTDDPSGTGSAADSDAGQPGQTDQSDQSGRALDTGNDQREVRYDPLRGEYLDENYDPIPGPDGDSTGSGAGESRRDGVDEQRDQTDGDTTNDDTDE